MLSVVVATETQFCHSNKNSRCRKLASSSGFQRVIGSSDK
jgi:hypothetical protein